MQQGLIHANIFINNPTSLYSTPLSSPNKQQTPNLLHNSYPQRIRRIFSIHIRVYIDVVVAGNNLPQFLEYEGEHDENADLRQGQDEVDEIRKDG